MYQLHERLVGRINLPARGRLRFTPSIDLDGNPASNPNSACPAPVVGLMGHLDSMVMLAMKLDADKPSEVAAVVKR